MHAAPNRSRLPGASEQPFAAQLGVNLFVGNGSPRFLISLATSDGLDLEAVLHVFQTAIVGETIQECAHRVFCGHEAPEA